MMACRTTSVANLLRSDVLRTFEQNTLAAHTRSLPMFVTIETPLSGEARHIIGDALVWFNADRRRAELLLDSLGSPRKGPSLRLMDHLVVHYCKDRPVAIAGRDGVPMDLWGMYRRALNASGKKYFDAFKRYMPVRAVVLGQEVNTTLGQLRFLAWFQELELHNYLRSHLSAIREHMNTVSNGKQLAAVTSAATGDSGTAPGGGLGSNAAVHVGMFQMTF